MSNQPLKEQDTWNARASTASGELLLDGAVVAPGDAASHRLNVDMEKIGWRGSLAVFVDRHSVSAAELFAGYLQDAKAATVIGERTHGAGCGFLNYHRSPIVLPTSGLQVVAPDCVILRKDGRNSAAGVHPDVPIDGASWENLALFASRIVKAASSPPPGLAGSEMLPEPLRDPDA